MISISSPKKAAIAAGAAWALLGSINLSAQELNQAPSAITYADLADLAAPAEMVVRAKIKKQAEVEPERAPGLRQGWARLYIEAETLGLISGSAPLGESLRYLVDVPRDSKDRAPKLKKREVILFARPVAGNASQLRLVAPDAQLMWSQQLETQLRPILAEMLGPDSRPAITGIRDALSIRGNLAGESETQIFLSTKNDGPVSVTVIRRPGMVPQWGVSWSEIVDQAARPPQRATLEWYRLACFLPASLPGSVNLARDSASRAQAAQDYDFVVSQLGNCTRNRS
ncbi:hypothetical protein [Altererythrobacter sp. ZODW24]|uniref:hypothetical protein n=1 Tax=Altererythrobacter sp. ZODW24 TaxID=2185142 RepID=UPI000DF7663D|nr:hypothetical protein [Altererythrobacter sp. ZODW24]